MSFAEDKQALRREVKHRKLCADALQKKLEVERLWQQVERHPRFCEAQTVLLYYALPDEVPTQDFIEKWYKQKRILLPVVVGDDLELRLYSGSASMYEGSFHILEPEGVAFTDYAAIDLAIIPAVALDKVGHRLGRGKGYYDRLLSRLPYIYKIGIAYSFQFFPSLPSESHDILLDETIGAT